jgi:hypothetical protein
VLVNTVLVNTVLVNTVLVNTVLVNTVLVNIVLVNTELMELAGLDVNPDQAARARVPDRPLGEFHAGRGRNVPGEVLAHLPMPKVRPLIR